MSIIIDIGTDFARYPFGRYKSDGEYSGERFRQDFLERALRSATGKITVILDGARGMGSSFLEEAFGGLVREGFDPSLLKSRIEIVSRDATRVAQIEGYINEARRIMARARA